MRKNIKDNIARLRGDIFRLRCLLFHKNIRIGKDLKLYCRLDISGSGIVEIGNNCIIRKVDGARNSYVTLFTYSSDAFLKIGNHVKLISTKVACKYSIEIGHNVIIEDSAIWDTMFHSLDETRGEPSNESKEACKISIGNGVKIGARSIITKGVTIGKDSIVSPCSVVQKSIPEKSVVFGNPAKQIKMTI